MSELPQTPYDTVCVSGGFDPVHIGHLRMIQEASEHGQVIVIVNSDDWLMRKKGYIFMPFAERCEILAGFRGVTNTIAVDDTDGTVCEALRRIKPTYFANGGDRKNNNTPEMDVCEEEGIRLYQHGKAGGFYHSSIGQEAIAVAAAFVFGKESGHFLQTYRVHALYLALGGSVQGGFAELMGKKGGCAGGKGGSMHMVRKNMPLGEGIVGGKEGFAAGMAFANKYLGKKSSHVVSFLGDGATAHLVADILIETGLNDQHVKGRCGIFGHGQPVF